MKSKTPRVRQIAIVIRNRTNWKIGSVVKIKGHNWDVWKVDELNGKSNYSGVHKDCVVLHRKLTKVLYK